MLKLILKFMRTSQFLVNSSNHSWFKWDLTCHTLLRKNSPGETSNTLFQETSGSITVHHQIGYSKYISNIQGIFFMI